MTATRRARIRFAAAVFAASVLLPAAALADWIEVDAGRGAVDVAVPEGTAPAGGWALLVLLHGYGFSGAELEAALLLAAPANARGIVYAIPDGTQNILGERYWNATDACCDVFGSGIDDVGYLLDLVDAIDAEVGIDARRVAFAGHSNGGFMSFEMACSAAERVAAVASLAGATWNDPADCDPSRPVPVLQMHGTLDDVVAFEGGVINEVFEAHPGAQGTIDRWVDYDGCVDSWTDLGAFDADSAIAGDETSVARYDVGCKGSGAAELWVIDGAGHAPTVNDTFRTRVLEWIDGAIHAIFADRFEAEDFRAWTLQVPAVP
jgi:polyhydroxybutyrate depolymerase